MTVLLALVMVATLGTWIPLAQLLPGTPGRSRVFYAAVGNAVFAGIALLAGGPHLVFGWRGFWLPLAGGMVWTAGNYCVFKASETIGLARAAGTWTPLNIVVAFAWGALLFGELDGFSAARFAVLGAAFLAVVAGVLLIAGSREDPAGPPGSSPPRPGAAAASGRPAATAGAGLLWAVGAGVLWGSYFVPAQWAAVPAQVSDFPLALGILAAALALALPAGEPVKLGVRATGTQLGAGVLFGIGNLALLVLVARVGTGTGFTIAQLSLLVNASIGVWVFHVPEPGTRQARKVLAGIVLAGIGGCVIAAMR
ncbi:MAG TPA: GRP family sugar transporter [Streptosporangiaceae bacterium]|jgi:glucose uptake protein|nr:GRP family sugar transporter [Streptosporangiaceae bacterium]